MAMKHTKDMWIVAVLVLICSPPGNGLSIQGVGDFAEDLRKQFQDVAGIYSALYGDPGNFGHLPKELDPTPTPEPSALKPEEVTTTTTTTTKGATTSTALATPTPEPEFYIQKLNWKDCPPLNISGRASYDSPNKIMVGPVPSPDSTMSEATRTALTPRHLRTPTPKPNPFKAEEDQFKAPLPRRQHVTHLKYGSATTPTPKPPVPPGQIRVETKLASPAKRGDKRLDVASSAGFEVGGKVTIGKGASHEESFTLLGFGSLLLDKQLRYNHDPDEAIEQLISIATPVPTPTATPVPSPSGYPLAAPNTTNTTEMHLNAEDRPAELMNTVETRPLLRG